MLTEPLILDRHQLAAGVKAEARALGFDLVGICDASPTKYRDYFRQWLDDSQAGTMSYLATRFDERVDPAVYFPGARSVICVAMNYHAKLLPNDVLQQGRVARYALGDDYHEIIKPKLHVLADWIRTQAPEAQTRCGVDTAPIAEKELAARAGIGWMGKNTCVINQQIGSWLLLGEIITTIELPADDLVADRCGTCRRCIDACPTAAITEPYQLDARRCISYLNIEHRGEIEAELAAKMGGWLYGCDICQEVCPWNHDAPLAIAPELQPRFASGALDLADVVQWNDARYRDALRGSAMKRVKLPVLQRNASLILENLHRQRDARHAPGLPAAR